ncbi:MAG TPA: hypothetical protein VKD46_05840, partial [bacterium]|nr:hypothetical protein [bacterium]
MRRLLLPGTRYHLYYVYDQEASECVILAVWSAVRGRARDFGGPERVPSRVTADATRSPPAPPSPRANPPARA